MISQTYLYILILIFFTLNSKFNNYAKISLHLHGYTYTTNN